MYPDTKLYPNDKQMKEAAPFLLRALRRLMACPALNLSWEEEDVEAYREASVAITKAVFRGPLGFSKTNTEGEE